MEEVLIQYLVAIAMKYPITLTVIAIMGTLRAVFKPIMAVAHAYVLSTPKTSDDELLAQVEQSKIFKGFAWLLDYVASIKLPGR